MYVWFGLILAVSLHEGTTSSSSDFGQAYPEFRKHCLVPYTQFLENIYCKSINFSQRSVWTDVREAESVRRERALYFATGMGPTADKSIPTTSSEDQQSTTSVSVSVDSDHPNISALLTDCNVSLGDDHPNVSAVLTDRNVSLGDSDVQPQYLRNPNASVSADDNLPGSNTAILTNSPRAADCDVSPNDSSIPPPSTNCNVSPDVISSKLLSCFTMAILEL